MRVRCRGAILLAVAVLLGQAAARAEDACPLPPSPFEREANIFSPRQEMDLGDAMAAHLEPEFRVVNDAELNAALQRVGDRLIKHLPPSEMRYRFVLFDLPEANAFSMPGGRVYVARKMVAFARSEAEIAALLAHEIGHIYTHQQAHDFTRYFRAVLGVTEVGDREDILRRFDQLLDNQNRRKFDFNLKHEEQEQMVADRLAVYAMARAGYPPQAFGDFWDRFAETHGKTGGFFSDLFGVTSPESKRLREILKTTQAMPPACVDVQPAGSAAEFQNWRGKVVAYKPQSKEQLHGVLAKKELAPPLQIEFSNLRFSPDGKLLLAQDESSIFVVGREPLAVLFRIPAEGARAAQFTPDSRGVVFHTRGLRVEAWDAATRARSSVHEMVVQKDCLQTALSPDGRFLACFNSDRDLDLLEVATGAQAYHKKEFFSPSGLGMLAFLISLLLRAGNEDEPGDIEWVNLGFSPDAGYFAAGSRDNSIGVDLRTRTPVPLPGNVKDGLARAFTFLDGNRVAVLGGDHGEKSALLRFPTGETLARYTVGRQTLQSVTRGDYLLLRPIDKFPLGVFDIQQNRLVVGNHRPAVDMYDGVLASEARDGEVALSRLSPAGTTTIAAVTLPRSPLARLATADISEDFNWLAYSSRTRGAVFDLRQGTRVILSRGFRGSYFAPDGLVYADFPKYEETERTIARMDPVRKVTEPGVALDKDLDARQRGPVLMVVRPKKKDGSPLEDVTLEAEDARNQSVLWTRTVPGEAPERFTDSGNGVLALVWETKTKTAHEAIRNNPALSERFKAMQDKKGTYYVEVLELRSGKPMGRMLLDTGKESFRIQDVMYAQGRVVINDNHNRLLVYALESGEQMGHLPGNRAEVSRTGLLAVEGENDALALYDLASMRKLDEWMLGGSPAFMRFSADGKRLFVLTKQQTALTLDTGSAQTASAVH